MARSDHTNAVVRLLTDASVSDANRRLVLRILHDCQFHVGNRDSRRRARGRLANLFHQQHQAAFETKWYAAHVLEDIREHPYYTDLLEQNNQNNNNHQQQNNNQQQNNQQAPPPDQQQQPFNQGQQQPFNNQGQQQNNGNDNILQRAQAAGDLAARMQGQGGNNVISMNNITFMSNANQSGAQIFNSDVIMHVHVSYFCCFFLLCISVSVWEVYLLTTYIIISFLLIFISFYINTTYT